MGLRDRTISGNSGLYLVSSQEDKTMSPCQVICTRDDLGFPDVSDLVIRLTLDIIMHDLHISMSILRLQLYNSPRTLS